MNKDFELVRITASGHTFRTHRAQEMFSCGESPSAAERWVIVAPHDDDAVLGAGLLIQFARSCNVETHVLVTSDGAQGYNDLATRDRIAEIRLAETERALHLLGVTSTTALHFPDGRLHHFAGRWPRPENTPETIAGYTGMQNSFTHHLRRLNPTRAFICTSSDIHPDHQVVHRELLISLFHSAGTIWPELGAPMASPPTAVEMAVYCDFPSPPDICLKTSARILETKLAALSAFASQTQIASLIDRIRLGGPVECFRQLPFLRYNPSDQLQRFE